MQLTPKEIWKRQAVLVSIYPEDRTQIFRDIWLSVGAKILPKEIWKGKGYPSAAMVKELDCEIVVACSNSSSAIAFTFGQIPFGKATNPLILPVLG